MSIELRPFDGDLHQLRSFLFQAWSELYQGELFVDFSEDFLAWHLYGPRGASNWALGAYEGGRLGGFLWGLPLSVSLSGQENHATEAGLLAVSKGLRGRNVAVALARRFMELHEERRYTLSMGFFDGDHRSLPLYQLVVESGLFPIHEIATVPARVKVRVLDLPRFLRARPTGLLEQAVLRTSQMLPLRRSAHVRPYAPEDLQSCLDLLRQAEAGLERPYLCQRWGEDDLAWQLQGSPCVTTLVLREGPGSGGRLRGFVNYFRVEAVQRHRVPCGIVDHLLVRAEDRRAPWELLSAALACMADQGCALAVFPMRRGRRIPGLARAGFVTLPRKLVYCLVAFPRGPEPQALRDFYVLFR